LGIPIVEGCVAYATSPELSGGLEKSLASSQREKTCMTKLYRTNEVQESRIIRRMDDERAKNPQMEWDRLFRPTLKAHRSEFSSLVARAFFANKNGMIGERGEAKAQFWHGNGK